MSLFHLDISISPFDFSLVFVTRSDQMWNAHAHEIGGILSRLHYASQSAVASHLEK